MAAHIVAAPIEPPQVGIHLQRRYLYFVRRLSLTVEVERGTSGALRFNSRCVRDWQNSPLCQVNPNRQALVGRVLILSFGFTVELDGSQRVTRVHF